jgi:hypothetical protein
LINKRQGNKYGDTVNFEEYLETQDALFHYTKTSVAIEHILYTKKFKLSTLYDADDPREYKFKTSGSKRSSSAKDVLDYESYRSLSDEAHIEINRILRFECRRMSFCSNVKPTLILSDNDHKIDEHFCSNVWAKSRMWSQYGEGHRGICLVLSKSEIEKAFNERKTQVKKYKADYVKYLPNSKPNPIVDLSPEASKNVKDCASKYVMDNFELFFFHKHIDYRDEGEFRVVVFDPNKELEYLDICASLKGVIVGDRIHDPYVHLIKQMCKDINIECLRAHWSISSPHMLLVKCK